MTLDPNSALVVLSGGQDSTTCLFWARCEYPGRVHAITFDYGQRHIREIEAAREVARLAGVTSHEVLALPPGILESTSPIVNQGTTLEQYEDFAAMSQEVGDRVESTFVPMRNALFLTLAANRAVALGVGNLVTGVCQQDTANYPDCRLEFIEAQADTINKALGLAEERLRIETPLMYLTKADSIKLSLDIPGAYEALAWTHTAYDGAYPPLGNDHATLLRAQGFADAGVPDPLIIRAVDEGLMPWPGKAAGPHYDFDDDRIMELVVRVAPGANPDWSKGRPVR